MSERFEMHVVLGTVSPAMPKKQIVTDPDGFSRFEMSDRVEYDRHGQEVARTKGKPSVRWRFD